jgi:hypothetical protein
VYKGEQSLSVEGQGSDMLRSTVIKITLHQVEIKTLNVFDARGAGIAESV